VDAWPLLSALADLGDYFAVAEAAPPATPSLARLYAGDPALDRFIDSVAQALGTSERRVAGSILVQGVAARLWSPSVASVLLHGRVVTLAPQTTWWSPRLDAGRLQVRHPSLQPALPPGTDPAADALAQAVVQQHLSPLVVAVRRCVSLPVALLWGNASSALVGSLGVLVRARPEYADAGTTLAEALLARPPLAGTGTLTRVPRAGPAFVRSSCCLYYRVPGGGLCGDCALRKPPT
jgi:hypothetical protein